MILLTRTFFKYSLRALLFLILVVFYYLYYMRHALKQFNEKRTTMAESIKQAKVLEYPILVFCTEPGFKPSFLKKMRWNLPGTEKFIWKNQGYYTLLQNVSSNRTHLIFVSVNKLEPNQFVIFRQKPGGIFLYNLEP